MEWMLDIQLGRRNLSPIQRIAVAEKYRPIYEKQAKENLKQATGGDRRSDEFKNQGLVNLPKVENKINTSEKLASIAGVSDFKIQSISCVFLALLCGVPFWDFTSISNLTGCLQ